jgi:lipid A 3-O-deacylase
MRQRCYRNLHRKHGHGITIHPDRWMLVAGLLLILDGAPVYAGSVSEFVNDFRQAAARGQAAHVLDIDNDSLLLTRRDGFYSSGLRYTQQYELHEGSEIARYGWRLGQELYTASDIKLTPEQIPANDHPYAGWLYAGVFKEAVQPGGAAWKWGVDLGCLGPCAGGEWTQTTLHRILNQPLPEGWDTQLDNEAGVVLYAEQAFAPWRWGSHASLSPVLHGRFGNIFTDAGAALILRIGRAGADRSSLHGYFRLDGRAVGYNATLQGGYFSGDHARTVAPKRLVGEAEAGVVWRLAPYAIRISVIRRSNEIRGLPNSQGSQNIGSLQISYFP